MHELKRELSREEVALDGVNVVEAVKSGGIGIGITTRRQTDCTMEPSSFAGLNHVR